MTRLRINQTKDMNAILIIIVSGQIDVITTGCYI